MYKIKMSRYQAFVYFMVNYMNRNSFNGEESRMALHEESKTLLVRYIVGNSTPSGFLTSSKTNINYVSSLEGNRNLVPEFIFLFLQKHDIVFIEGRPHIVIESEEDLIHYRIWIKMKSINAMLYDGEKSVLFKYLNKLTSEGYFRLVEETHRKIYNKGNFVDGATSVATRQYEFSHTKDLNNLETVFTDKYYITFEDIFDEEHLLSSEEIIENILIKMSKNSIISKSKEYGIISDKEILIDIESRLGKFFTMVESSYKK